MWILIHYLWDGAQEPAFLTSFVPSGCFLDICCLIDLPVTVKVFINGD